MTHNLTNRRYSRRHWVARAVAAAAGLGIAVAGYLSGVATPVSPVFAACGVAYNCAGGDPSATAALLVTHAKLIDPTTLQPVEPNDGENWTITPTYSNAVGGLCGCTSSGVAAVTADVTWSDSSGWAVACTGCNVNGPVYAVSICSAYECGSGMSITNGWGYKLIVDVAHTLTSLCNPPASRFLTSVGFTTTVVDNGNLLDVQICTEGANVSPTSQTWNATDTPTFECSYACDVTGAQITILYQ